MNRRSRAKTTVLSKLLQLPESADPGKKLNEAMKVIERENDDLKDVLPKPAKQQFSPPSRLRAFALTQNLFISMTRLLTLRAVVKRFLNFLLLAGFAVGNAQAQLTLADVQTVVAQAVTRATGLASSPLRTNAVIALTDREGWVLGVWALNTNATSADPLVGEAIAKAGTAAFLSSGQNAFSTRTAGFIVQQHFPPGIANKPPGPLVGVNFSQLGFSDINKFKAPGSVISYGSSPGLTLVAPPLPVTGGLAGTPGGLPLYKNGQLVGGVGVAGNGVSPTAVTPSVIAKPDSDEDVALAGQTGFAPANKIFGSQVLIDGIRLEYIESSTSLGAVLPFGSLPGKNVSPFTLIATPAPFAYPVVTLGGETGELRQPIIADPSAVPLPYGPRGSPRPKFPTSLLPPRTAVAPRGPASACHAVSRPRCSSAS